MIDANNKLYYGGTVSLGVGTSGAECHVEWGKTVFYQFNIYDFAENIYVKIMEW